MPGCKLYDACGVRTVALEQLASIATKMDNLYEMGYEKVQRTGPAS